MNHRGYYDPLQDSTPLPEYVEKKEAERKAHRAFRYGMVCGAVLFAAGAFASAAWSETINIGRLHINGQAVPSTTVSIEPSDEPGQWAVVTFTNEFVNDGNDDGDYTLTLEEVVIGVTFTWEANPVTGADQITVTPPFGITCEPESCVSVVPEGGVGTIILLDFWGA